MDDLVESSIPQGHPPSRQVPSREDCWTEEATSTLVDAWGRRYVELNRGNLRQKDWQEVADVKKYKTEKAKISDSNGTLTSSWPFFSRLEFLIGSNFNKQQSKLTSSALPLASSQSTQPLSLPSPPMAVPLPTGNRSLLLW
ncbi:UNVERIFIED_CONTAM: Trihelix transcription factor ASIL2 [Sesamum calycinum]|uniref:Trihelix transcription factor ASIL2 n=1 Tax=Sesamum calycinum TaxID=2727403 RepID=A0AAW2Q770_9LAMI